MIEFFIPYKERNRIFDREYERSGVITLSDEFYEWATAMLGPQNPGAQGGRWYQQPDSRLIASKTNEDSNYFNGRVFYFRNHAAAAKFKLTWMGPQS